MAAANDVLADAFSRIHDGVTAVVDDLDADALTHRVGADANPIGWLVWHLLRVQDDHVADVAGTEQVWTAGGWQERSGLPLPADSTGYGHSAADVAAVRVDAELLTGYADAVHRATLDFLGQLTDEDFSRVVDDSWDPPVTLSARLVSVIGDDLKHLGQAEYVRGLL